MCIRLHVKYPLLSFHVNQTSIFFADFRKILNFTKNRPEGAELLHADGMTDMTKLMVFWMTPWRLNFICDVSVYSVYSICCILSFWRFPGVWILCADVSKHSVPSS